MEAGLITEEAAADGLRGDDIERIDADLLLREILKLSCASATARIKANASTASAISPPTAASGTMAKTASCSTFGNQGPFLYSHITEVIAAAGEWPING